MRFCGACGHALAATVSDVSGSSPSGVPHGSPPSGPTGASQLARPTIASTTSDPPHAPPSSGVAERFTPGQILASRYRIVSRLGRGGMGEVYRADDLKLGQAVALKFLPEGLAHDPGRLALLHDEVKLARQISHPHVCRVHDIGEADGQTFISMEFVDGEDLAALLRRIGRLPPDKGVQVARQLCLGLAAAHERGVIHRDLKPANVMLDGRGQLRITDFGLARLTAQVAGADARSGTPAYMAPEQLAGREATARSDLYALGLVLYEIFTGKQAFPARSRTELLRLREQSTPPGLSSHITDLDPAVERVILRCLEKEPRKRPLSALAVAAALPGGDPLAAALAAGETPSPEMVAAAGEAGGLRPAVGLACLAGVVLGFVVLALLGNTTKLVSRVPLPLKPDVLENRAETILRQLGYEQPYRAYGFGVDRSVFRAVRKSGQDDPWAGLATLQPPALYFWYRQSPQPLVPTLFSQDGAAMPGRVTPEDPPALLPKMALVRLDPKGRLTALQAIPPAFGEEGPLPPGHEPDWPRLFPADMVGFSLADEKAFTPTQTQWAPPVAYDARKAWRGTYPESGLSIQVEAATYRGKPVFFRIVGDWNRPDAGADAAGFTLSALVRIMGYGIDYLLIICSIVLAVPNLRAGRGDRRGALRLALASFAIVWLSWFLQASHVATLAESDQIEMGLAWALFFAAKMWLCYIALEPYVRRLWPETLVSWSRLLAGRVRDPLVGASILIGLLAGVGFAILEQLVLLAPPWFYLPAPPPFASRGTDATLMGGRFVLGYGLYLVIFGFRVALIWILFFLLLLRVGLRNPWLAAGTYILFQMLYVGFSLGDPRVSWFFYAVGFALVVVVLMRYGVLAAATLWIARNVLLSFPLTADLSAWFGSSGLWAMAVLLLLAGYGFWTSQAGRPRLSARWLGEE